MLFSVLLGEDGGVVYDLMDVIEEIVGCEVTVFIQLLMYVVYLWNLNLILDLELKTLDTVRKFCSRWHFAF